MTNAEWKDKIAYYYGQGLWSVTRVRNAVTCAHPVISEADYEKIVGKPFNEDA